MPTNLNDAPHLVIRMADWPADFPQIQAIRYQVFQVEQGVDAALEFDGQDAAAQHILATWQGQPVGTARLRWLAAQVVKVERVAVLKAYRGQGIGQAILGYICDCLGTTQAVQVRLHAQTAVQDFYQRLGFVGVGEPFEEAGIAHITMQKNLAMGMISHGEK